MKKYYRVFFRFLISASLLFYLYKTQDIEKLKYTLESFNLYYLLFSLLLLLTGTFISSLRWKTILNTSSYNLPIKKLFILYLQGYFFNNFLPTQMGGDVYKSVNVGKKIKDQSTALFSVFMDRFGGLIVLVLIALFGISFLFGIQGILISFIVITFGLVLYFPILNLLSKRIKFFKKFKKASLLFLKDKRRGFLVLFYSFLIQLFSFSSTYVLFLGLGISLPLWSVFAFMPIAALSLLIPSFNGFGTQEFVYSYLFANVGVTSIISISASLLIHLLRLIMSLFGGISLFLGLNYGKK